LPDRIDDPAIWDSPGKVVVAFEECFGEVGERISTHSMTGFVG
jgi:hypothetical protein